MPAQGSKPQFFKCHWVQRGEVRESLGVGFISHPPCQVAWNQVFQPSVIRAVMEGGTRGRMGTEAVLTQPVVIQEGSLGEVLAEQRLKLPDARRRKDSAGSHRVSFPGLEGPRGVSLALSGKQAAGCFSLLAAGFCPSFQQLPKEGFSQKQDS